MGYMPSYDLNEIMNQYNEEMNREKDGPGTGGDGSRAEAMTGTDPGTAALRAQLKNAAARANDAHDTGPERERLEEHRAAEFGGPEYDTESRRVQDLLSAKLTNALNVKNAQKVILISNRENIRKGLSKENQLTKGVPAKGQTSTVTIPTQLLRYVQQEVGGLSCRATQNDIMAGFLYWYFGKPEDVQFSGDDGAKMQEILENLDLNASPARVGKANFNMTSSLLERLDTLTEQISLIASLMTTASRDSSEIKMKSDKMFIALCYNILSFMAFAPPIQPGERPEDVDLLANGMVWDLMAGVDSAYDYFKTKNGREIYKSRARRKMDRFAQFGQPGAASGDPGKNTGNGSGDALYGGPEGNPNDIYMKNGGDHDNESGGDIIDLGIDYGDDEYGYGEDNGYSDIEYDPNDFSEFDNIQIKDADGERFDKEFMDPKKKLAMFRGRR